jgi:hypothetical protein
LLIKCFVLQVKYSKRIAGLCQFLFIYFSNKPNLAKQPKNIVRTFAVKRSVLCFLANEKANASVPKCAQETKLKFTGE